MYKLSVIIEEAFRECLPLAEKRGVMLNLDFMDVTKRIARPSRVRGALAELTKGAIERAKQSVTIKVDYDEIMITDDGRALRGAELDEITKDGHISAKSRVGFGTEITIQMAD